MTNKNYDLEFLRGLSVLLVFFFHFNTNLFNSFFVGVDIFFLVSGYVITGSVLQKDKFYSYCDWSLCLILKMSSKLKRH